MGRSWEDRVAEYVDSPRLRQRVKIGPEISCLIDGNSGTYRTHLHLRGRQAGSCTCPSEYVPCKHVHALRETYKLRPRSFVDFESIMKKLAAKDKPALLKLIREMAVTSPPALAALGVKGFEPPDEEGEDEDYG